MLKRILATLSLLLFAFASLANAQNLGTLRFQVSDDIFVEELTEKEFHEATTYVKNITKEVPNFSLAPTTRAYKINVEGFWWPRYNVIAGRYQMERVSDVAAYLLVTELDGGGETIFTFACMDTEAFDVLPDKQELIGPKLTTGFSGWSQTTIKKGTWSSSNKSSAESYGLAGPIDRLTDAGLNGYQTHVALRRYVSIIEQVRHPDFEKFAPFFKKTVQEKFKTISMKKAK